MLQQIDRVQLQFQQTTSNFQFRKRDQNVCVWVLCLYMRMCVCFSQYMKVSYPIFPGIWVAVCPRASVRGIIRHLTSYSAN